jgi:CRISPR/Cas system CMR subunit Cmr6 (Cas7 group RAMP superfamily)
MSAVAGPLNKGITLSALEREASPLILLRRVAVVDAGGALDDKAELALLRWAAHSHLGQDSALIGDVIRRRERALAALRARGHTWVRLRAEPEWRLAVGLGNRANPHEIGMSLHGTYGWPIIPGSSLKGLTATWAAHAVGTTSPDYPRVFGSADRRGSVHFLDAIPAGERVNVVLDVLTPHHQPYYASTAGKSVSEPKPPAEHHNPVPVHFLTVIGAFDLVLFGRVADEVMLAARWLIEAGDELGAGAKTTSGYGYLKIHRVDSGELRG